MKPAKVFFLLIVVLTLVIIFLDWVRNYYFPGQVISPIARIKTIVIIVAGIIIMKLTFTSNGFKLFLVIYLGLWLIYWVLNFMFVHKISLGFVNEVWPFYQDTIPLESPLPFIFFWFVDRMFLLEKDN
jgi:hypothetical protein